MTAVYAEALAAGKEYQDFAAIELYKAGIPVNLLTSAKYQRDRGETMAGVEVKYDRLLEKTGNLYFETHEKSDAENAFFVLSGIFRKDNAWLYAIGDYRVLYLIPIRSLLRLYDGQLARQQRGEPVLDVYRERETPTSMGFTLKADWVEKHLAAKVLRFTGEAV